VSPHATDIMLRCAAAGCALLCIWCLLPRKTWGSLARRLGRALAAFWRYLVTNPKDGGCPDCARAQARSERAHPARQAGRRRVTGISDEEAEAHWREIRRQLGDIPEQRDGSAR
jgi:hypothetical protein